MPDYRRLYYPGGLYFLTINLQDRSSTLLTDRIDNLRSAIRDTKTELPFELSAMVVLPDHIHMIMALPQGDADFSTRIQWIKSRFSRTIPKGECVTPSRARHGERGIWQRRFWEHLIRDERDLEVHVNYIHFNPVKHGLVACPIDWPYSSIHRFIANRWRQVDWGAGGLDCDLGYE